MQLDPESTDERVDMFVARGAKWKRLRVISNPTFTAAKIKQVRDVVTPFFGIWPNWIDWVSISR